MRIFTLLFIFLQSVLFGQQPAIGTTTILPQPILPGSSVTIVTKVTTPAQGVLVDKTFTVNQNPGIIELRLCYGFGLLPATQTYVDTFKIGILPAGTFSIHLKAYMSSANQHCARIDSNEVMTNLSGNISGLDMLQKSDRPKIYPNPARSFLFIESPVYPLFVEIINANGSLMMHQTFQQGVSISLDRFPSGLYTLRYLNEISQGIHTFLKE